MKITAMSLLVVVLAALFSASLGGICSKNTYYLKPDYDFANGNIVFGHLDMDASAPDVQDSVAVAPGQKVTAEVKWTWGTTCPECSVYVNSFGDWNQKKPIASLFSGVKGSAGVQMMPVLFTAPTTLGEYTFRVIFVYGNSYASDFDASDSCQGAKCEYGCSILFAEGVVNVTDIESSPPVVKIVSPYSTSGIVSIKLGTLIKINGEVSKPSVGVSLAINGQEISNSPRYEWDTSNIAEGVYVISLKATDSFGNTGVDSVTVQLLNTSKMNLLWSSTVEDDVRDIEFSESENYIVFGTDNYVYLYDVAGSRRWKYRAQSQIVSVAVDSKGEHIAAGAGSEVQYISSNGSLIWTHKAPGQVTSVAVDSKGEHIAAGAGSEVQYISSNGSLIWTHQAPGQVTGVAVDSKGEHIAAGAGSEVQYISSNGLNIWNYSAAGNIAALSFKDEDVLMSSGDKVYILRNGAADLILQTGGEVGAAHMPPSGQYVAYSHGSILFLSAVTGASRNLKIFAGAVILLLIVLSVRKTWFGSVVNRVKALRLGWAMRDRAEKLKQPSAEVSAPQVERAAIAAEKAVPRLEVAEKPVYLRVSIVDAVSRTPISGAEVVFGEHVEISQSNGEAAFADVSKEARRVTITKKFYAPKEVHLPEKQHGGHLDAELTPAVGLSDIQKRQLGRLLTPLEQNFKNVSSYDVCIPSYYRSIGKKLVYFVGGIATMPIYFDSLDYEETVKSFTEVAELVCAELANSMVDWKNIQLYKAAKAGGLSREECTAADFAMEKMLLDASRDLRFLDVQLPITRGRLAEADSRIINSIRDITIFPVSEVWKLADGLLNRAVLETGIKKAALVITADRLIDYMYAMLESQSIMGRLRYTIF